MDIDFSEEERRKQENERMHGIKRENSACLERRERTRLSDWRMGSCLPEGWTGDQQYRGTNQLVSEQLLS